MNQLKWILLSRIEDIHRLKRHRAQAQQQEEQIQGKYDIILEQKKNEKIRTIKETQLIINLNFMTFTSSRMIQQFYDYSVEICKSFDEKYQKYEQKFSVSMKDNIQKLYLDFFDEHGFKQKSKLVLEICSRGLQYMSPSMLLGWLSQWSKKIYCQMLQQQIRNCLTMKKYKKINYIPTTTPLKKKQSLGLNINSSQNGIEPSENSAFLLNRITVYGYFYDDMLNYYKFLGLQKLDMNYLKTIRRQGKKQQLLKIGNMNKAAQIMVETTQNKDIKGIMEQYEKGYRQKFPKKRQHSPTKKTYLKPLKKVNSETQNFRNNSKLLSPKNSNIQFINPGQIQAKINRLRQINKKIEQKNNVIQFPNFKGMAQNNKKNIEFSKYFLSKQNERQRQMPITQIQSRMKSRKLLKNQSMNEKVKVPQGHNFQEHHLSDILVSQKMNLFHEVQDTDYDDAKIKAGKRFTLADLRKHGIPSQKRNLKKLTNS